MQRREGDFSRASSWHTEGTYPQQSIPEEVGIEAAQGNDREGPPKTSDSGSASGRVPPTWPRLRNFDLWQAASQGDSARVLKALEDGADFKWFLPDSDEHPLVYKHRKVSAQALHAAAASPPLSQQEPARGCVNALLHAKADVKAKASIKYGKEVRQLEAIHFAAGAGNVQTLELLIENRADPNAMATLDREKHYVPIHDAAWFNQVGCVESLLAKHARVDETNKDGETALHLAAKLGHHEIVKTLLLGPSHKPNSVLGVGHSPREGRHLILCTDKKGKVALDMAVENGHFPSRYLYYFTSLLDGSAKARAFIQVAMACPDAAPAMLRSEVHRQDSEVEVDDFDTAHTPISEAWLENLRSGADDGTIDVRVLSDLVLTAPQSAADLIEAVSVNPIVQSPQHHPLPVRAMLPSSIGNFCGRMSCEYELDKIWTWDPVRFGMSWHTRLAPHDAKGGQEVQTQVMLLPGVLDCELVHCLAASSDTRVFSKLMIQGLLKYLWVTLRVMFLIELTHHVVTIMTLSYWIVATKVETPEVLRRCMWGIVASHGTAESLTFVWTCAACVLHLHGPHKLKLWKYWVMRCSCKLVAALCTIMLAASCADTLEPKKESEVLLSLNALSHWLLLLYDLRVFQWTGKRLLPIMKSILPIAGMAVIMLFVSLAFLHAFWALNRDGINEISLFHIVTLLFTGEHFMEEEELMKSTAREAIILLSMGGVFIFLTCTINVFIAVLGDCYDQEQEKLACTFLKERARICSGYFLRPRLNIPGFFTEEGSFDYRCWLVLFVVMTGIYAVLLILSEQVKLTPWLAAISLAGMAVSVQCILLDGLTKDWTTKHLWICHEATAEEDPLQDDEQDRVEHQGHISRIKKFVLSQCRLVETNSRSLEERLKVKQERAQQRVLSQKKQIDELSQKVTELCHRARQPPSDELVPMPSFCRGEVHSRRKWCKQHAGGSASQHGDGAASLCPECANFQCEAVAEADDGEDLQGLGQELARMKTSISELRPLFHEQEESQRRLESSCQEVAAALRKVVELANRHRRQAGKVQATLQAAGSNVLSLPADASWNDASQGQDPEQTVPQPALAQSSDEPVFYLTRDE